MDLKKNVKSFLIGMGALSVLIILIAIPLIIIWQASGIFSQDCIAEVDISGELATQEIPSTMFSEGIAGSETIAKRIKELNDRSDVKSVLFVVNSPGGGIVASKEIFDAIRDLKKPKVVYFREVAASGGYYISTPADWIVSEPDALTANIGARAEAIDFSGLMDKIGVNHTSIKSGENKDMGSPFREMTPKEKQIFESIINESYQEFKSTVIKYRGDKLRKEDEIFDSRVMSGRQAYAHGLVDQLGNKQDAIDKAGELGGFEGEPRICKIDMSPESSIGGLFMKTFRLFAEGIGYGFAQGIKNNGGMQTRIVYQ